MSVKGGQILHDANGFLLNRIQTAGAASINQAQEKIYELGNYNSVATIRDIPDLTFDLESYNMNCKLEAILTGFATPDTIPYRQGFDFSNSMPIDIVSPFKSALGQYDIVKGVAIPYLTLERATYRFGVKANSTQQFSLRGDSIVYIPGQPYYKELAYTGAATYAFGNTALKYTESGIDLYALCVTAINRTTKQAKRLFNDGTGTGDYTNTNSGFTVTANGAISAPSGTASGQYNVITFVWGSTTIGSTVGGTSTGGVFGGGVKTYPQTVHDSTVVTPAAVRGKDIDVYLGSSAATPVFTRWTSVQSIEVTRSVNLDNDEELGNAHYVTQDYVTADVTGTVNLKPRDVTELFAKVQQIAGFTSTQISNNDIIGPFTTVTIPIEIRISHPDTGLVIKTLYIPDARFTMPGIQGRANAKLETAVPFASDTGSLTVFNGDAYAYLGT